MFDETEKKVIKEKLEQLKRVKEGIVTAEELAELIMQRRVAWFEKNKDAVLSKYAYLSDEEKAYRIIFFDHMKINPEHSKMEKIDSAKIKIKSYNFCPYLEACKQLDLDTKFVCKEVCEQSIQKVSEMINPKLKFSRNYQKIRPYNYFCEEYFEIS